MWDINTVNVSGRLTRDPELFMTKSGIGILSLTIAINHGKDKATGDDKVSFVDCKVFGQSAEFFNGKIHKGAAVSISGRLQQERWEKDGKKNSKIVINVEQLINHVRTAGPTDGVAEPGNSKRDDDEVPF